MEPVCHAGRIGVRSQFALRRLADKLEVGGVVDDSILEKDGEGPGNRNLFRGHVIHDDKASDAAIYDRPFGADGFISDLEIVAGPGSDDLPRIVILRSVGCEGRAGKHCERKRDTGNHTSDCYLSVHVFIHLVCPVIVSRGVGVKGGREMTGDGCAEGFMMTRMTNKLRWGALSTANIGMKKVLPAMQNGQFTTVTAIASRDLGAARAAADALGIPTAYGSYEELIADPNIDAIYNPLPNQMHVPWTIKAAEAGKHVLCEKPLSLNVAEAKTLLAVRARTGVKIGEAFMIRSYTQWLRLRELLAEGRIGELRSIVGFFSYFNNDPGNIRNQVESGGGALLDIGCYCIHASRYAFGQEPTRVVALVERDPAMKIDRLTSAILDFPGGQSIFTCSTQLTPYQKMQFLGTRGRIEIEIPFNAPKDRPTRLFVDESGDLTGSGIRTETFPTADQYTMQGDAFSKAVLEGGEVPVPLEEAIRNMAVIEAVFRSGETGRWESPEA